MRNFSQLQKPLQNKLEMIESEFERCSSASIFITHLGEKDYEGKKKAGDAKEQDLGKHQQGSGKSESEVASNEQLEKSGVGKIGSSSGKFETVAGNISGVSVASQNVLRDAAFREVVDRLRRAWPLPAQVLSDLLATLHDFERNAD